MIGLRCGLRHSNEHIEEMFCQSFMAIGAEGETQERDKVGLGLRLRDRRGWGVEGEKTTKSQSQN